jgi:hypothetical protein
MKAISHNSFGFTAASELQELTSNHAIITTTAASGK